MFIPKALIEEEQELEKPEDPLIDSLEAQNASDQINKLLKRKDICSNAESSNEKAPLVILLHGYGSSKWIWIKPYFGSYAWLRDYKFEPKPRSYGWHSKPPPSHMYLPFTYSISPLAHPEGTFNFYR